MKKESENEVDLSKNKIRRFFQRKLQENLEIVVGQKPKDVPPLMDFLEKVIETFGWVYPQDTVNCCIELTKLYYPNIDTSKWFDEYAK
jgi:hypothetical protein